MTLITFTHIFYPVIFNTFAHIAMKIALDTN